MAAIETPYTDIDIVTRKKIYKYGYTCTYIGLYNIYMYVQTQRYEIIKFLLRTYCLHNNKLKYINSDIISCVISMYLQCSMRLFLKSIPNLTTRSTRQK